MDRIKHYQDIIINFLKEYAAHSKPVNLPDVASHVIIDRENNHFQFTRIGWQDNQPIFVVIFHFEIKDSKIWIHRNQTEKDVVAPLLEQNVPSDHIVLGFQPPYARKFTGLAEA